MKSKLLPFLLLVLSTLISSCYRILPSKGGGQLAYKPAREKIDPADVIVPEGYKVEVVSTGLTYPTAVTFDEDGVPYVIEAGYSYGEEFLHPKLIRIEADGTKNIIATGDINGPWNGITYHDNNFYVAEGGELEGGKILRISKGGDIEVLLEDLPSLGDHHTNGPVIKEGYIYFAQGTATNSAVVGNDNAEFGWLKRFNDFHDIPCEDIVVNGKNFETQNVLTENVDDVAVTGPFSPYNSKVEAEQVIKGAVPCNGAIMRIPLNGGDVEVVAWGLRNPYGLALAPDQELYITENSFDVRGSRPVWGTGDNLWKVEEGMWYGWPDFIGGVPISKIEVPGEKDPQPVMAQYPNDPPHPVARLGVHSSSNGFAFSHNDDFGFKGYAFVAQFGDMAANVGKVLSPVGFRVIRVDVGNGIVEDFALNRVSRNGPASLLESGGLERPVDVAFNPGGDALYIVDFGIMQITKDSEIIPYQETGVLWKITKE